MDNSELSALLRERGATLVGFADLSALPADARRGFRYGISIGIVLNPQIVAAIPTGPHLDYYDEYRRVSDRLNELSEFAAVEIEKAGYPAFPQSRRFIKQDTHWRTPLPHKTVAHLAGLGWIGKSAVLVTEKYGGAVRLGSVLTDMPFEAAIPIDTPGCGGCRVCVEACPGKAIKGPNWEIGLDRNELLDPEVCKKTVIKRGEPFGLTEGTCGVCIAVCPLTKTYAQHS